jgi:hypothetical protein
MRFCKKLLTFRFRFYGPVFFNLTIAKSLSHGQIKNKLILILENGGSLILYFI